MDDRNAVRCVGVNRPWSATTRATKVARVLLRTTLRWRKANQVVAAGPNIAVEGKRERQRAFSTNVIVRTGAHLRRKAPYDRSWQSHASLDLCGRPAAGPGYRRCQIGSIHSSMVSKCDRWRTMGGTYCAGDTGREDWLLSQPCLIPVRYLVLIQDE